MADQKLSAAPAIDTNDIIATDEILVLDKSDTSHAQSGTEGTWKRARSDAFRNFGSVKVSRHFLNLDGQSSDQSPFEMVASAINSQGPFSADPGAIMVFSTYQFIGTIYDVDTVLTNYKLITGDKTVGTGSGVTLYPSSIVIDGGPFPVNPTSHSDLYVELGDIGAGPVETSFNLGDTSQTPTAPWTMSGLKFVTATISSVKKIYLFVGADGDYGPSDLTATSSDFTDLTSQPGEPPLLNLGELGDVNLLAVALDDQLLLRYNQSAGEWQPTYEIERVRIACSDLETDLTTKVTAGYWFPEYEGKVLAVYSGCLTGPVGAALITDINKNGTTILSTKITIDDGDKTSLVAATPPVISVSTFLAGDEFTIDRDQVGSTTKGKGHQVIMVVQKTG